MLTYLNLITYENKKELIVGSIIDIVPELIHSVINQPDNTTYLIFKTGETYKIAMPFKEFSTYLSTLTSIDITFKEEVFSFLKNNYGKTD